MFFGDGLVFAVWVDERVGIGVVFLVKGEFPLPEFVHLPDRLGDLDQRIALGLGLGQGILDQKTTEGVEALLLGVIRYRKDSPKTMTPGIHSHPGLAGLRLGTGALEGISPIGFDLTLSRHSTTPLLIPAYLKYIIFSSPV